MGVAELAGLLGILALLVLWSEVRKDQRERELEELNKVYGSRIGRALMEGQYQVEKLPRR